MTNTSTTSDADDYHEVINEYGYPQYEQANGDGTWSPVCCQCHAAVMPNRGQGMICDKCDHEVTMEWDHDHF